MMAIDRPPWPTAGSPVFAIAFADAVFSGLPAACFLLGCLVVAATATRKPGNHRRILIVLGLAAVLALDIASTVLYALLPANAALCSAFGLASYLLKTVTVLALFLLYWRLPAQATRLVGFYIFLASTFDAVRLHSIWTLSSGATGTPEKCLAIIQSVLVGMGVGVLILEAAIPHQPTNKTGKVQVNEQGSSTLGRLFFGWVFPLLSLGRATSLVEADIRHIDYHPYCVHREDSAIPPPHDAWKFYSTAFAQYAFAFLLSLVAAVASLLQPFIIGAIVRFMQAKENLAVGVWLVIAMFADEWTSALCTAHRNHLVNQVDFRLKSYLTQKVFQRALSPNAQVGSAESVSSKAMIHASIDVPTVLHGPQVMIVFLSNMGIVVVASYMLYMQIGLAFMGPLILAIVGTVVPLFLGPQVAKSQRAAIEATEMRIQAMKQVTADVRNVRMGGLQYLTAEQVGAFRESEVKKQTNLRRIMAVVVVIALCLESLCVLAAFTIFAIDTSSSLDYSKLFTSLSILAIMIGPLLVTLQSVPDMISGFVSWQRVQSFIRSKPDSAFFANRQTALGQGHRATQSYRDSADASYLLRFDQACLGWTDENTLLRNVSAEMSPGDILVVTGRSASGKSSLLKYVLGEGQVHSGLIDLQTANLAFCDQTPWFIADLSLCSNIILDKAFERTLYEGVVKCCCLAEDFARQEIGDQTTIDSKGTSLSGGQRARLSLARALYQEASLLLLDDIFTGLDKNTLSEVVDNVFGPEGYLSKRPHIAVMLSSSVVPPLLASHAKAKVLLLKDGQAALLSGSQLSSSATFGQTSIDEEIVDQEDGKEQESTQTDPKTLSKEEDIPETSSGESLAYVRSLGSWQMLMLAFNCTILSVTVSKVAMFWLTLWSDAYSGDGPVNSAFYVSMYAVFTIGNVLLVIVVIVLLFLKMIPTSGLAIHSKMLTTFLQSRAPVIEATRSQILNRFTQDIRTVDNELPISLINVLLAVVHILAATIVIGIGAPYSLILVVVAIPPLWMLQKHYLATSTRLRVLQMGSQAPILDALGASLDGRLTLRAFNLNDRMMVDMTNRVHRGLRPGYLFHSLQTWLGLTLDIGNTMLMTLVSATLVTLNQQAGIGWGALALVNALNLAASIKNIMSAWTAWEMSMGAMTRISSYTRNTPVESVNGRPAKVPENWPQRGEIVLKGLTLAYTDKEIVRDMSLDIPAGKKVAILGRTGSGKTSIMQSFFGLLRTIRGCLTIDGIEVATVEPSLLRSRLVGNPQQTFSNGIATLRRNLDPSQNCSDEDIRKAIEGVAPDEEFHNDIMSKLDDRWEECSFSAGWQRQIGLARMMLRMSKVYILDEPTSGMDEADHDAIMDCLFTSLTEKTVIVITHTIKGIEKFDHVAVMADGQLIESAPPAELLRDSSSQLYKYVHGSSGPSPSGKH